MAGEDREFGRKAQKHSNECWFEPTCFAMHIGTTQQNGSNYENGLTEPSLDCLTRIASEFSISLDELLLGKFVGIEQEYLI